MAVEFRVSNAGGSLCAVHLDVEDTLLELKAAIEASTGIPAGQQRLFHGLQELAVRYESTWGRIPNGCGRLTELWPKLCDLLPHNTVRRTSEPGELRPVELLLVRRSPEKMELLDEMKRIDRWWAGGWLRDAPRAAREDKEIVMACVAEHGHDLKYAAPALQADPEVVQVAVSQQADSIRYAPDEMKANREVVLAAAPDYGRVLELASPELRADREVVLTAMRHDGSALRFAAPELRADPEVVLAALATSYREEGDWGLGTEHLVRDDDTFGPASHAFAYAAQELKTDRDFVLAAVEIQPLALRDAAPDLQVDRQILCAAATGRPDMFAEAIHDRSDRDDLLEALPLPRPVLEAVRTRLDTIANSMNRRNGLPAIQGRRGRFRFIVYIDGYLEVARQLLRLSRWGLLILLLIRLLWHGRRDPWRATNPAWRALFRVALTYIIEACVC